MLSTEANFTVSFSTREGLDKTGPLDLLWNLIRNYEVDIFEVSLVRITNDFVQYIQENQIALEQKYAFSQMATRLIYYKSTRLLPQPEGLENGGSDENNSGLDVLPPEIIDKLLEYKKLQVASEYLEKMQVASGLGFQKKPEWDTYEKDIEFFKLDLVSFLKTFQEYLLKADQNRPTVYEVEEEEIIVEEIQKQLYKELTEVKKLSFFALIKAASRLKLVGFFLAILEMCKQKLIHVSQDERTKDILIELR